MSRSSDTRRLYREENQVLALIPHINRQLSLGECQRWVSRICSASRYEAPAVQFGPGVRHGNQMLSWNDGPTVELAPGERDFLTIAHESTHHWHPDHDAKFRRRYFKILRDYAGVDAYAALRAAKIFGLGCIVTAFISSEWYLW